MKNLVKINNILITFVVMFLITSCNNDAIYNDEHYKIQVYLLSGAENVYTASYTLNEIDPIRWVTVGCGGSNTNDKEIVVTLEPNPEMLDRFNSMNYDYVEHYAQLLHPSRYEIESYDVTLPARSDYHYARMPVKVFPLGLSPDSTYFIPLKIRSVSNYEVNEDKLDLLYRVVIENDYAKQVPPTMYSQAGQMVETTTTILTGNKRVHPLESDKVRMFIGNETYSDNTTVAQINRLSVVVQILPDNTLLVTPYSDDVMEVEMLDDVPNYNRYDPAFMQGSTKQRVLFLNYRFRNNTNGTWSAWRTVEERLMRVEDN